MNGVEVVLTREDDKGLYQSGDKNKKSADMKKRIEIINKAKPRLMVSIHQNSYHQPEISGAQVFYFGKSEEGKIFAELMQKRFDYVLGKEYKAGEGERQLLPSHAFKTGFHYY